jgi:hypothetical protein
MLAANISHSHHHLDMDILGASMMHQKSPTEEMKIGAGNLQSLKNASTHMIYQPSTDFAVDGMDNVLGLAMDMAHGGIYQDACSQMGFAVLDGREVQQQDSEVTNDAPLQPSTASTSTFATLDAVIRADKMGTVEDGGETVVEGYGLVNAAASSEKNALDVL